MPWCLLFGSEFTVLWVEFSSGYLCGRWHWNLPAPWLLHEAMTHEIQVLCASCCGNPSDSLFSRPSMGGLATVPGLPGPGAMDSGEAVWWPQPSAPANGRQEPLDLGTWDALNSALCGPTPLWWGLCWHACPCQKEKKKKEKKRFAPFHSLILERFEAWHHCPTGCQWGVGT